MAKRQCLTALTSSRSAMVLLSARTVIWSRRRRIGGSASFQAMVHGFSLQDIKSIVRPRFRTSRAALVIVLPRCHRHLPPSPITTDAALIHRRHVLGLLAAASILPSRSFANVAPQRSEIREDLAKRFTDEGTAGTFVGYKTDDYLLIASDKERSGQAMLPASTFKIPNSLIALETGVVGDPDKDIFKWDGVTRSIGGW